MYLLSISYEAGGRGESVRRSLFEDKQEARRAFNMADPCSIFRSLKKERGRVDVELLEVSGIAIPKADGMRLAYVRDLMADMMDGELLAKSYTSEEG